MDSKKSSRMIKINLTKDELINELAWCLDMTYPLKYKGKRINARLSKENCQLMARSIYELMTAYMKDENNG